MILLWGCVPSGGVADPVACDARELEPGEVRVRTVPCTDELPDGSDAHTGDWVLENAVARFFFRSNSPLTELEGDGGSLIDAFLRDGADLLLEAIPDGDRSSIEGVQLEDAAELRLPGLSWRLEADSDQLQVDADLLLKTNPGSARVGSTLRDLDSFLAVDGEVEELGGAARVRGASRLSLSPESRWPEGERVAWEADADSVLVGVDGVAVDRLSASEAVEAWVPAGASAEGEREGCLYDGLEPALCASLRVRAEDAAGQALRVEAGDGDWEATLPLGGGVVGIPPGEREVWVWAGPAWSAWPVEWSGEEAEARAILDRRIGGEGVALVAAAVEVGPDLDTDADAPTVVGGLVGEGVDLAVLIADDEVPLAWTDAHDPVLTVAGSRAAGMVWSWPWDQNSHRPAHGAVDWIGRDALEVLAMSEGGQGTGRITVVTAAWVEAALALAEPSTWDPRPDAIYLEDLDDLDVLFELYTRWTDLSPLGPRSWVEYSGAKNVVAIEAGIVAGRTSAGNGPRVRLEAVDGVVELQVEAPKWMGIDTVTAWSSTGSTPLVLDEDGGAAFASDADWVLVSVEGARSRPWGGEPAWAVSAPLWLGSPLAE